MWCEYNWKRSCYDFRKNRALEGRNQHMKKKQGYPCMLRKPQACYKEGMVDIEQM